MDNNPYSDDALDRQIAAEEAAALALEIRKDAWAALAKTPKGRLVIADILRVSGWLRGSYVQGDTHATAYREGQRSVGQSLYDQVNAFTPSAIPDIHKRLSK